jgi:transcriptional regulator with XRE-family HTH domain
MKLFKDKFDKIKDENLTYLDALVLQDRFVSEIQKKMEESNYTKKKLANNIGVSASYITQVFRGNKFFNLNLLAAIQNILDIDFKIQAVEKGELETSGTLFYQDYFIKNISSGKTQDIPTRLPKPEYDKLTCEKKPSESEYKPEKAA